MAYDPQAPGEISIIIPNLHSPIIGAVIAALRAQALAGQIREIIVVGQDRYGQLQPDALVRPISTEQPVSAARARNLGAAEATGEYLLFLDADCLLAPDALGPLLQALGAGYGAVVGGIMPETAQYWRLCGNLMSFPEFLAIDPPGERSVLPSFCLCMPRAIWQQVGPFTERFAGASAEDLDLSLRMRQAGLRLGCAPSARVFHRPARNRAGVIWRRHAGFGRDFYDIYQRYRELMPRSEAIWLSEHLPAPLARLAVAPLACAYVARLMLRRPQLRRFWYALPGMALAQFGWYCGMIQAARAARSVGRAPAARPPG